MARPRRAPAVLPPLPPPGVPPRERLRSLRLERGLSLNQLARLAGMRKATLVNIERGRTLVPHHDTLARIAAVFGLTADVLRRQIGMHGPLHSSSARRNDAPEQRRWSPRTERVALLMETLSTEEQAYIEAMCRLFQARQFVPDVEGKGARR
jgi:transcriptional regulator with XRE-family HTH domain